MFITYKDITVHVTMTFGVEENDYPVQYFRIDQTCG